jgi:protein-S-isoprenylcysteine O-methyltransferase Ste14
MNKTAKALRPLVLAALVGAAIGAFGRKTRLLDFAKGLSLTPGMRASVGLWLIFNIYWSIASKDSAPKQRGESSLSRLAHMIAVNGALLLLILPVPGLTGRLLPDTLPLNAIGLTIQAASVIFAVWARRHLGSNWSGQVRIATGHQLVRSGPYRLVRHPIYTALVGMYIGTAVVSGQIHALLALTAMALAYWRKIQLEERVLADAFPGDHERYRGETWAWIPGLY